MAPKMTSLRLLVKNKIKISSSLGYLSALTFGTLGRKSSSELLACTWPRLSLATAHLSGRSYTATTDLGQSD